MKPFKANLINALSLIFFGAWGYIGVNNPSKTALIPIFFGVLLLLCHQALKRKIKLAVHIAVILTALILLSLLIPLIGSVGRGDGMAIFRIIFMMLTSTLALLVFIRKFADFADFGEKGD